MRCRRLKFENGINNVVWFGSYGINQDGTAKFYNPDNKYDNYSDEQLGVADSLTQRLSIIRQELWYAIDYGLPLLEKVNSRVMIDSAIADIVMGHPDVISIASYQSTKNEHSFSAKMIIRTIYGDINLQI